MNPLGLVIVVIGLLMIYLGFSGNQGNAWAMLSGHRYISPLQAQQLQQQQNPAPSTPAPTAQAPPGIIA